MTEAEKLAVCVKALLKISTLSTQSNRQLDDYGIIARHALALAEAQL